MKHVLKTTHFVNSHFADTVDQSEQRIVTVDQSEPSIESAKCVVFSTCFYRQYPTSRRILDKSVPISCPDVHVRFLKFRCRNCRSVLHTGYSRSPDKWRQWAGGGWLVQAGSPYRNYTSCSDDLQPRLPLVLQKGPFEGS